MVHGSDCWCTNLLPGVRVYCLVYGSAVWCTDLGPEKTTFSYGNATMDQRDLYAELGVGIDASDRELTKAYRKLALKFHPDKSGDISTRGKFEQILEAYAVLSDRELKRQYDAIRGDRASDEDTELFRQKLRAAEAQYRLSQVYEEVEKRDRTVAQLQKEGLLLRQAYQRKKNGLVGKPLYTRFRDLSYYGRCRRLGVYGGRTVEVKWKLRKEMDAQIDEVALRRIMEVFGRVVFSSVTHTESGYGYGIVEFVRIMSAQTAASHDYKSAMLWDGTSYRRLASLLRSCKVDAVHPIDVYTGLVLEA